MSDFLNALAAGVGTAMTAYGQEAILMRGEDRKQQRLMELEDLRYERDTELATRREKFDLDLLDKRQEFASGERVAGQEFTTRERVAGEEHDITKLTTKHRLELGSSKEARKTRLKMLENEHKSLSDVYAEMVAAGDEVGAQKAKEKRDAVYTRLALAQATTEEKRGPLKEQAVSKWTKIFNAKLAAMPEGQRTREAVGPIVMREFPAIGGDILDRMFRSSGPAKTTPEKPAASSAKKSSESVMDQVVTNAARSLGLLKSESTGSLNLNRDKVRDILKMPNQKRAATMLGRMRGFVLGNMGAFSLKEQEQITALLAERQTRVSGMAPQVKRSTREAIGAFD